MNILKDHVVHVLLQCFHKPYCFSSKLVSSNGSKNYEQENSCESKFNNMNRRYY